MRKITFKRSPSLTTIVLVLLIIFILQASISYTLTYGVLYSSFPHFFPHFLQNLIATGWLVFRALMIVVLLGMWFLYRKRPLFITIIIVNSVFTFALFVNTVSLVIVLFGISSMDIKTLLGDVVLLAVSNILIFSIWYWVIDPPGVEDSPRMNEPWDFLFPQRDGDLPFYESWVPRYTDYLYLAFTDSFAFSPTDTLPLTRRAKLLMLLQATISIITLTAIASSAINNLAGSH